MPQASTLIRTCPRAGSGMGRSTISKFPPGLLTCTAFTRDMFLILCGECDVVITSGFVWSAGKVPTNMLRHRLRNLFQQPYRIDGNMSGADAGVPFFLVGES